VTDSAQPAGSSQQCKTEDVCASRFQVVQLGQVRRNRWSSTINYDAVLTTVYQVVVLLLVFQELVLRQSEPHPFRGGPLQPLTAAGALAFPLSWCNLSPALAFLNYLQFISRASAKTSTLQRAFSVSGSILTRASRIFSCSSLLRCNSWRSRRQLASSP